MSDSKGRGVTEIKLCSKLLMVVTIRFQEWENRVCVGR